MIYSTIKGQTSDSIQAMYKLGFRCYKCGAAHEMRKPDGKILFTKYSWIEVLKECEKFMR